MKWLTVFAVIMSFAFPAHSAPKVKKPSAGMGLVIVELKASEAADFELAAGFEDTETGQIIQTEVPWFRQYDDPSSGRVWLIDYVKAGTAVLYAHKQSVLWEMRFNGNTPHFIVPDRGYVFVGRYDGAPAMRHILDLVKSGKMPEKVSVQKGISVCGQEITGYTAPSTRDEVYEDARAYLRASLKTDIELHLPDIEMKPFTNKDASGWKYTRSEPCLAE